MRRRQLLASGAALLSATIAGCGHPQVVLDFDAASADDVADAVSMHVEPGEEEHRVVTAARENGSTTRTGRYELFDREDTVRLEDAFYAVDETGLDREDVTVYEVLVDVDPENTTPEVGEIDYADLPETDRERLDRLLSDPDIPESEGPDAGVSYGTAAEVGPDSVFVPDPEYDVVVYEDEAYRISVESRTATQTTYRYEVTQVAPDVETFAESVREEYRFTLSGLSADERAVVEEAIEGGYFREDDAFESVVEKIRAHEGIDVDDFYGTWLLEYDGVEYLVYAEW
ncbi:MAG: hypothetical protein ACOCZD_00715 [Haloferacaceae archaeon]